EARHRTECTPRTRSPTPAKGARWGRRGRRSGAADSVGPRCAGSRARPPNSTPPPEATLPPARAAHLLHEHAEQPTANPWSGEGRPPNRCDRRLPDGLRRLPPKPPPAPRARRAHARTHPKRLDGSDLRGSLHPEASSLPFPKVGRTIRISCRGRLQQLHVSK